MILGTVLLLAEEAQAAVSGQIHARLTIIASCEVTNGATSPLGSSVSHFDLLDFGSQGPTWTNPINANLNDGGNGKLEVSCNPSLTGFTVTIDGGQCNSSGRHLQLDSGSARVVYQLFSDAAFSNQPGWTYSDVLQVQLSW